jgi:hypothetical protein
VTVPFRLIQINRQNSGEWQDPIEILQILNMESLLMPMPFGLTWRLSFRFELEILITTERFSESGGTGKL